MMNSKSKQEKIRDLWRELSLDTQHKEIKAIRNGKVTDLGLVNQFKKHDFIPNKWFDWESKVDATVMIVGQDWGPYVVLKKFIDQFEAKQSEPGFDSESFLFDSFSSRTEKFIVKALEETYPHGKKTARELSDHFFYSMAVLFTRKGKHFRGNHNFDPVKSAEHSYKYLAKQIDILSPKIIMTLGGLALTQVERYFELDLPGESLTEKINRLNNEIIIQGNTVIIPNYHPAAFVNPTMMLDRWKLIWKHLD